MNVFKKYHIFFLIIPFLLLACKQEIQPDPEKWYTCSMDPQVKEKKPGNCPICKMELTETILSSKEEEGIKLSDAQIKLADIKTMDVKAGSAEEGVTLRGMLVPDERKLHVVSSRVSGRIDRLYFKFAGEKIHAGDRVYDIYSEELQAAIQQYLLMKAKASRIQSSTFSYEALLQAAKQKLLAWGLSESQIRNIHEHASTVPFYSREDGIVSAVDVNEGDYVREGSGILSIADYSSLWIKADVQPEDMHWIQPGLDVQIQIEGFPGETLPGKIAFEDPELQAGTRVGQFRIEIKNKDGKFKPGMRASVRVLRKAGIGIYVPESAILFQPGGNRVWIRKDSGDFQPILVRTGIESNGWIEVKSGLEEGAKLVYSGVYLLDSEYKLRKGISSMDTGTEGPKAESPQMPGHSHSH